MHKRKLHIKSVLNLLLGKVGIVSLLILVQIAVLVVFILRLVAYPNTDSPAALVVLRWKGRYPSGHYNMAADNLQPKIRHYGC